MTTPDLPWQSSLATKFAGPDQKLFHNPPILPTLPCLTHVVGQNLLT